MRTFLQKKIPGYFFSNNYKRKSNTGPTCHSVNTAEKQTALLMLTTVSTTASWFPAKENLTGALQFPFMLFTKKSIYYCLVA